MNTDQKLVHALQTAKTKDAAFREIVSLYKERLYWHIRKIVLNHHDTDDVLQNTFIKVYKNGNSFKGESKLYSWMYRIATNEAITFLKKKAKRLQISDADLQEKSIENLKADVYFEGNAIQLQLQKAIATLPEKQRLVFIMKYFDALSYEEISEILQTSVGALKSSYHLAVKKITAYLTED